MMVGHTEVAKQPFGVQWHATHLGELSMLTVGDPLGATGNKQAIVYSDTSGGGYRRFVAVDDRLIGYLSVGTTQPDSLSIKRLIDEGLPIRDVIKPLLKGNFDARAHITKTNALTARKLVTGQLPPLEQDQSPQLPDAVPSRQQVAIQAIPAARRTGPIGPEVQTRRAVREGTSYGQPEPDRTSVALSANARESQQARGTSTSRLLFEEEINPFSGNLPAVNPIDYPTQINQSGGGNLDMGQSFRNQSRILDEEFNPFTGNLPAFNKEEGRNGPISGRNGPVSQQLSLASKPTTRNLWQYTMGKRTVREKTEK
jgi:hypothetical protein